MIATSELERTQIEANHYALRNLTVRPNPLQTSGTDAVLKSAGGAPFRVLFVGRICRTKNLPALLEAIAHTPNTHLTIAGPDDNDGTSEAIGPLLTALKGPRRSPRVRRRKN